MLLLGSELFMEKIYPGFGPVATNFRVYVMGLAEAHGPALQKARLFNVESTTSKNERVKRHGAVKNQFVARGQSTAKAYSSSALATKELWKVVLPEGFSNATECAKWASGEANAKPYRNSTPFASTAMTLLKIDFEKHMAKHPDQDPYELAKRVRYAPPPLPRPKIETNPPCSAAACRLPQDPAHRLGHGHAEQRRHSARG